MAGDDELMHAIEDFALTLTASGMQRMAARVFALLLIYPARDMTAKEIAEALQISPAAVSGAVRYLTQVDVISRGRRPGERVDHYMVAGDSWYQAMVRRNRVLDTLVGQLDRALETIGEGEARQRVESTRDFFEFTGERMEQVFDEWNRRTQ